MLLHTTQSVQAEVSYRQERLRRDYRRPAWFRRWAVRRAARPVPDLPRPTVRARHAV